MNAIRQGTGLRDIRLIRAGLIVGVVAIFAGALSAGGDTDKTIRDKVIQMNKLTAEEERVIVERGTEAPFSGEYYKHTATGVYQCKRCNAALYKSSDKFDAGCGWPSFDDEISGAVREIPDNDGRRVEIVCAQCGAHLGHVFQGERFTEKNTRHCVNSISLSFASAEEATPLQKSDPAGDGTSKAPSVTLSIKAEADSKADTGKARAYFAGGCFWGTEYFLEQAEGVITVRVGYMGGQTADPSYEQVCSGTTGHAEAVEIEFDPTKTNFETLARLFFEIHDPDQVNRQGPDIGAQYRSVVFYLDDQQKATTEKLIGLLRAKGHDVATEVVKADKFWPAENYHQNYYAGNGKKPYCHAYQKKF